MSGQLFTQYYLTEGIKSTTRWHSAAANMQAFGQGVRRRCDALRAHRNPNEAVTEQELIRPVLELLGWTDYLPQQGAARNEDIPDLLLFSDSDSKARAAANNPDLRYGEALVVEESKRFGLPLDARDEQDPVRARTPHGQILRYLSTAEYASDGGARWGILTNGGVWRLYDRRARPRATGYFEVDLADIFRRDDEDELRTFNLLFRRDSFVRRAGATETFLERALEEGAALRAAGRTRPLARRVRARLSEPRAGLGRCRRAAISRTSARRRWSSSTGCCSCSTPKTAACCP